MRWGDVCLINDELSVRRSICPYDDLEDEESWSTETQAAERLVPRFRDALEALEDG